MRKTTTPTATVSRSGSSPQEAPPKPDLRFALLTLPGIQDIDFVRQAGTFLCYVYGISPVVPPSLISLVQGQLDSLTAYPMVGTAASPALVGISFTTTLTFLSTASASDQVS